MTAAESKDTKTELHEIDGALDVLFTLREEFAQWLEEARTEDRKEELESVFRHIETMEQEYQRRREAVMQRLAAG